MRPAYVSVSADPLARTVGEVLVFPNRDLGLEIVDQPPAGGERDIAVSARAARITGSLPVSSADAPDAAAALAAAEAVGSAMIQAGYSVETVQDVLGDIARVNGLPESEVLVFPNALLVSARGQGQHQIVFNPSGR